MRPRDLPEAKAFKHGTRARYVAGCRCRPCTHANVEMYHRQEAESKAAALDLGPQETAPTPKLWTAPDGTTRTRIYKRGCPGVRGEPCRWSSHLRKDSTGDVCARCRRLLTWNGLVPAKAARHHLLILSNAGVGYKSVADAASVSRSVVAKIVNGTKKTIRANTERAILEVDRDARADHSLVDARPVWEMVERLMRVHGYTKSAISKWIGQDGQRLQLGKRKVTARNALKVAKMLRDAEGDFLRSRS